MKKLRGVKHDAGKVAIHLVPNEFVYAAGRAFGFGAKKYSAWNWTKGLRWSALRRAAEGHLRDWFEGEELDPESGLSHLDHLCASVAMLVTSVGHQLGEDDRPQWRRKAKKKKRR